MEKSSSSGPSGTGGAAASSAHFLTATSAALLGSVAAGGTIAWRWARRHLPGKDAEVTLALIKPDAVAAGKAPDIIRVLRSKGFSIIAQKQYTMSESQVDAFYAEHKGKPFFPNLKAFMTSGPIIALALQRVGAIPAWRALMGPTATEAARRDAPRSIRALYGTDTTRNATHGSDSAVAAARELAFHFPALETTFAMIKPDAVAGGHESAILRKIHAAGFAIVAQRRYTMTLEEVEEFYAEHKGRPFFEALTTLMASGPVVALALRKPNAILEWRAMLGPTSTDAARAAAPGSVRALFGTDGTRNAAHGSDSVESAARELAYHFPPLETTLALIKPDAVSLGTAREIERIIVQAGFAVVSAKYIRLTEAQVDEFYEEHKDKPFFPALRSFMTEGRTAVLALQRRGAVAAWRALMGPTDAARAKTEAPGTVRALFGSDTTRNAVHGSDSVESAARELGLFFPWLKQAFPYWGYAWV